MRCRLYLNLGLVYDSLGDGGRRGRYLQRSVFLAERARLDEDLQRAYFNLGAIHLRHGRHPRALRCLQRARDCARRLQDKALESECCSGTGQVGLAKNASFSNFSGRLSGFFFFNVVYPPPPHPPRSC